MARERKKKDFCSVVCVILWSPKKSHDFSHSFQPFISILITHPLNISLFNVKVKTIAASAFSPKRVNDMHGIMIGGGRTKNHTLY